MELFPQRLRDLRKSRGLSQDDLAEKLGLRSGKQTISNWETGRSEPPLSQLKELARIFEISISSLMGEPETEEVLTGRPGLKCIPVDEYISLLEKAVRVDDLQRRYDELLKNQQNNS